MSARDDRDPLAGLKLFDAPAQIFSFEPASLEAILDTAVFVLDTNALLMPFGTGKEGLAAIGQTLETLAAEGRLVVPGQVAREFAANRAEQLKDLFQQLSRKRNLNVKRQNYPLLQQVTVYEELLELEAALEEQLAAYRKAVDKVLDHIRGWYWNDPVSSIYRAYLGEAQVVEPATDSEAFLNDFRFRQMHKIPPGYKDAGKEDLGVGDLLIWKAILHVGATRKTDVIFVSADRKADWWHQSEGLPLYPRFELVEEFRRETKGRTFHIMAFSDLLGRYGASEDVVTEVRREEVAAVEAVNELELLYGSRFSVRARPAVLRWAAQVFSHVLWNDGGRPDIIAVPRNGVPRGLELMYFESSSTDAVPRVLGMAETASEIQVGNFHQVDVLAVCGSREIAGDVAAAVASLRVPRGVGVRVGYMEPSGEFASYLAPNETGSGEGA